MLRDKDSVFSLCMSDPPSYSGTRLHGFLAYRISCAVPAAGPSTPSLATKTNRYETTSVARIRFELPTIFRGAAGRSSLQRG